MQAAFESTRSECKQSRLSYISARHRASRRLAIHGNRIWHWMSIKSYSCDKFWTQRYVLCGKKDLKWYLNIRHLCLTSASLVQNWGWKRLCHRQWIKVWNILENKRSFPHRQFNSRCSSINRKEVLLLQDRRDLLKMWEMLFLVL